MFNTNKMKRNEFIKKSILTGVTALTVPTLLANQKEKAGKSTYDSLIENVGYNHIPNQEQKTIPMAIDTVLHKANTRNHAVHGWLEVNHTFSFANYYNPDRMNFGVLRVLNDDKIAPSKGFSTHPHDNMEIISIPLAGALKHKDNMGNGAIIKHGDVQVMSAGTGITHSEFNANDDSDVKLLQIWLFPNAKDVTPRYDQISIEDIQKKNSFYQILSPNKKDQGVWIHQNAWFHLGEFDKEMTQTYKFKDSSNGIYVFVIEGDAVVEGQQLNKRDGYGLWNTDEIEIKTEKNTRILLMEVPMTMST